MTMSFVDRWSVPAQPGTTTLSMSWMTAVDRSPSGERSCPVVFPNPHPWDSRVAALSASVADGQDRTGYDRTLWVVEAQELRADHRHPGRGSCLDGFALTSSVLQRYKNRFARKKRSASLSRCFA